jgi:hypothetical protein
MSSLVLRYPSLTVSFLPSRRERQISRAVRTLFARVSRRQVKRTLRNLIRQA